MDRTRNATTGWSRPGLTIAGAGLLAATGAIHLDLYLTGYRSIPTIGWLFLLQVISAFGLAVGVFVTARMPLFGRLVAAAGAGFALSTLAGYLLSVWVGLFGFEEVRTTAGIVAGVLEVVAAVALAAFALAPFPRTLATRAIAAVSVVGVALFGAAAGAAAGPASSIAGATLRSATVGGTIVLTDAKGLTLYWFAPDTATTSACYGSCSAYWPPVIGTPVAGPGVIGKLGTITRTNGSKQLTYDSHPLYTYVADTSPGQAKGNDITLNGGLWHEVTVSSQ